MYSIENGVAKCKCGREFYKIQENGIMCIKGDLHWSEEVKRIVDKTVEDFEYENAINFKMYGREECIDYETQKDIEYIIKKLQKLIGEE